MMRKWIVWTSLLLLVGCVLLVLRDELYVPTNQMSSTSAKTSPSEPMSLDKMLPGEAFIKKHLVNPNGTIKTNLQPAKNLNPNVALGNESLSETLGLWMLYAVEKEDEVMFRQSMDLLSKLYMHDSWIRWRIPDDNQKNPIIAYTNALVDDLRIVDALYQADRIWNDSRYLKMGDKIMNRLNEHQIVMSLYSDFYDFKNHHTSDTLTLSYVNTFALNQLYEDRKISEDIYRSSVGLLKTSPLKNGLFPFDYHIPTGQFRYHHDVNLIDQLLIACHRARINVASPELMQFLRKEFKSNGLIYGRYDMQAKKPSVSYESPAVYGLVILYALQSGENSFAKEVYYRMIQLQIRNPENPYYGGYMDYQTRDTHSFDNLIPLLAERKLFDAKVLR